MDVVDEDAGIGNKSRNLKSLITKGGCVGRIRVTENKRWKYLPKSNN